MRFRLNGNTVELTADDVRRKLSDVEPEPVYQLGFGLMAGSSPLSRHSRRLLGSTAASSSPRPLGDTSPPLDSSL
jgi:hypothetical protein